MTRIIVTLLFLVEGIVAMAQSSKNDTITFIGKCCYVSYSRTVSITAKHYYYFQVINVVRGSYPGEFISFEADVNSTNPTFLNGYKRGEPTNLSPDSIFFGHSVPVDQVHTCTSEDMEISVVRSEEIIGWPEKTAVVYYKTWNKPRVRK